MSELSRSDVRADLVRAARHVHASSFFLQRGLQADLPALFEEARIAGATTRLDTGWAPHGEWAEAGPVLSQTDYLLPNAAECGQLAAALDGRSARGDHPDHPDEEFSTLHAAKTLHRLGPVVAVKLGAAGALAVGPDMLVRVRARGVVPVDTTGAGDCFDAGFIAALLDGSTVTESLKRAVSTGSIAVTGWGGTGRLASRQEAIDAAGQLSAPRWPHPAGNQDGGRDRNPQRRLHQPAHAGAPGVRRNGEQVPAGQQGDLDRPCDTVPDQLQPRLRAQVEEYERRPGHDCRVRHREWPPGDIQVRAANLS